MTRSVKKNWADKYEIWRLDSMICEKKLEDKIYKIIILEL